jgi:hypothetical protein
VGKLGVQKILLICLINIHNFRNSDCFLVDRSAKNLTTLTLKMKYYEFSNYGEDLVSLYLVSDVLSVLAWQ